MLRRLEGLIHRARARRTRDERGSAMLLVVTVVLVGFMISAAISAASLGSVRQTTQGRSNVQAFAAAEAGRDVMAAGLTPSRGETCPHADSDEYSGQAGESSWKARLYYRGPLTVPSDTSDITFSPDGSPDGAWTPTTCAQLVKKLGQYDVVVAVAGQAPDGTRRVVSAVYPFEGTAPVDSIVAPVTGPVHLGSGITAALDDFLGIDGNAYVGDLVITGEDDVTNFTCGDGIGAQPTIINGDVYVLNGNAEFRKHGCHIKGELYVKGDAKVIGARDMSLGGELGGRNRHLWVDKDVRVGRDFIQNSGGLTVEGSISAGRDVRLHERDGLLGTTEKWNQVQVGTDLDDSDVAVLAGRNVNLTRVDEAGTLCGPASAVDVERGVITGQVKAVGSIKSTDGLSSYNAQYCDLTGSTRENNGGKWRITGEVTAGTTVDLKDTPTAGISAVGNVTATDGSTVSGTVTSGGSVTLADSGSGAITAVGDVSATWSNLDSAGSITGLVSSQGAVSIKQAGNKGFVVDSVIANDPVSVDGAKATVAGTVTTPSQAATAVSLKNGAKVNGTVTTPGAVTVAGSTAGNTIFAGDVDLTGPSSTKAISAAGRVVAIGSATIAGDVLAGSPSAGSSFTGASITGTVYTRNPGVTLTGTKVTGSVQSRGPVAQLGGEVTQHVVTNGDYAGTASNGLKVGKYVRARGLIQIQNDTTHETVVGDGSVTPTIWAGATVWLKKAAESSSIRGTVNGAVHSNSTSNPSILVERTWRVTGEVRAPSMSSIVVEPSVIITPAVYHCVNVLGGGSLIIDNQRDCENASLLGYRWVVKAPQVDSAPGDVGSKQSGSPGMPAQVPDFTVNTPAVPTVVAPETLPVAPVAPTADELRTVGGSDALLDEGHWMDLSYSAVKAAARQSGYTIEKTYSGDQCKNGWPGPLLSPSPAAKEIKSLLAEPGMKYLFDTTACSDRLDFVGGSLPGLAVLPVTVIKSDAVFLVNNYKRIGSSTSTAASTNGIRESPRRILIIQPDDVDDDLPTCAGRSPLWINGVVTSDAVHTMYYSACGLSGAKRLLGDSDENGANTWSGGYGQLVLGPNSDLDLVRFRCRDMELGTGPLFRLTCDEPMTATDVTGTGGEPSHLLGVMTRQTEPSS